MKSRISLVAALPLALSLACTDSNKLPAEAALQAADTAVASLGDVAAKFAPQETQEVQQALAEAKALAAQKDYKGALAAASAIPGKAQAVIATATSSRDAMVRRWGELASTVPPLAAALKSQVEALAQAKKLPEGMQATLDQARTGATELEAGFTAALAKYNAGDFEAAITQAAALRTRGEELLTALGTAQAPAQPQ